MKANNTKKIKRIASGMVALMLTVALLFGFGSQIAEASSSRYIGIDAATTIALKHAGVAADSAYGQKTKLDREDGRMVYEVEFYYDATEYDYEIDALTGDVLTYSREVKKNAKTGQNSGQQTNSQYIGAEKAQSIAFNHAGVAADSVYGLKTKLDREDGRMVYEVEFYYDATEYDYEIDALTGDVLTHSHKVKKSATTGQNSGQQTNNDSYIGAEKAQSIAFNHAGVAADSVYGLKTKLDREDGRMVYEIEFKNGRMEYEYEIDATSGTILDWEAERD